MRIVITSSLTEQDELNFIYKFLPHYIYKLFLTSVDTKKLKSINDYFKIDSYKALLLAFKNLLITKIGSDKYLIGFNKNLVLGNYKLGLLLNIIANGNIEVKGYRICNQILYYVLRNINDIYEVYISGSLIL